MSIARRNHAGRRPPLLGRFRRDRRGAAAAEFSLILPVALILFTGAITYGNAIYIDRKVTLTARTVTDLITQYTSVQKSDITNVLGATSKIMAPFDPSIAVVRVSEVTTDASGNAKVVWSKATANGTPRTPGSTITLPTAIDTANVSFIYGEASYLYTPNVGYQVTGSITLSDQAFMSPRLSSSVPCIDCP
jgi:Flp pilus assembly protein TadG